jgi:seryl-tRNA synthetase
MHDIRGIRADPAAFDAALGRRGMEAVSAELLAKDTQRRSLLTALQERQARHNTASKRIGELRRNGLPTSNAVLELAQLIQEISELERQVPPLDEAIKAILEILPNTLDPDVPDGPDEAANVVLSQHGEPRDLGFQPKQHFELGEALGLMDFATAAKLAGARFVVLRGALARLERALGQFMIDLHTREHGYT